MSELVRFSLSIPKSLSRKFDRLIRKKGYENRSEAFRDIIRSELVEKEWEEGVIVFGTITLVYDHHKRNLLNQITELQHDNHELIVSTSHVHIDHNNCLEVIIVKGKSQNIVRFKDRLAGTKGVISCRLAGATSGRRII